MAVMADLHVFRPLPCAIPGIATQGSTTSGPECARRPARNLNGAEDESHKHARYLFRVVKVMSVH